MMASSQLLVGDRTKKRSGVSAARWAAHSSWNWQMEYSK